MLDLSLQCCLLTWVGIQPYWVRGSSSSLRLREPVATVASCSRNLWAAMKSGCVPGVCGLRFWDDGGSRVRNPGRAAWSLQQAQGSNSILALQTRHSSVPRLQIKTELPKSQLQGAKILPVLPQGKCIMKGRQKNKQKHHDEEKGHLRKCHEDFLLSVPGFPSDCNDCYLDVLKLNSTFCQLQRLRS